MKTPIFLALVAPMAFAASASAPKAPTVESVTVDQLTASVAADRGKPDADIAKDISILQLAERLPAARFARLSAGLPGDKSRQALAILADSATFLDPPAGDVVANPTPNPAELRRMIVAIVGYVNTKIHQLPNFIATRETTAFEDRPAEEKIGEGGVGTINLSYLPIHFVGKSSGSVTYRDNHEIVDGKAASKPGSQPKGLVTAGEFGPFLSTVLADAVKGKITWARWVQGTDRPEAVFHYQVPKKQSNYFVRFCCVTEDVSESFATHVYSEQAAYHGEIQFDPATGVILRITAEAELDPGELVSKAGMAVEYAPVSIGAKSVILPGKSVSLLEAHTVRPRSGMRSATYSGTPKTFLNDTVFADYHQFRGEARILTGESAGP